MSLPRIAILTLAAMAATASTALAIDRPNLVVILADDQGWGDLSVHGNANLRTPRIDSLARDGAIFDRFFVCPVCSPTRAEFLTGRYHPRCGVRGVSTGGERMDLDERTIADAFKAAGYATAAFGKWHNGSQYPYHPNARGFDEYYGFTSGHWGDYFSPPLEHNGRIVTGEGYLTDDLTDHAIAFIKAHRDRPFLCYLPFNTPHSPMQVPDRDFDRFKDADLPQRHQGPQPEDPAFTRAALAMCENIDANVGRLLDALDANDLTRRTIVVYFSDNGPNSWRWNGGMKGRKGSTDEGGVRSPLLIRWPGQIPPGTRITRIAGAIDLFPTLADLAGVPIDSPNPRDGLSLAAPLRGEKSDGPDRTLFQHWSGFVSARTQRYRLDAAGRLFDMVEDPGQSRDVARAHPDVAAKLRDEVARWRAEVLSELGPDQRPFPVGHREFPVTFLPARDGVPHGGVKRSAPAPNCSFFTNWSKPDDAITWDVEVATTGRYEAVLYQTCAPGNEGSILELQFGDARLTGKVSEPHDPPLRGSENDRVPRVGESYVKDFKPLRLGVIALENGRGTLTIRALEVPGRGVIDLRGLVLTLLPES
ncbi:MAG: arylsulfatase [Isosphaeraceae bacterium]